MSGVFSRNHNQKAMPSVIAHLPDMSCVAKQIKRLHRSLVLMAWLITDRERVRSALHRERVADTVGPA